MAVISKAAINNALLDPLQGFDLDVYVQDQATGNQVLVGNFTSFQYTVRNSTEPYMEFNQRVPRLLDGIYQFGWVMERGCLDVRFIQQTFGISQIGRELRISRSPRFQITVEMNAPELNKNSVSDTIVLNAENLKATDSDTRKSVGKVRLVYAKVDAFTFGAMAGQSVIANRWEGLCEGIYFSDDTTGWAGTQIGSDANGTNVAVSRSTATGPSPLNSIIGTTGQGSGINGPSAASGYPTWLTAG